MPELDPHHQKKLENTALLILGANLVLLPLCSMDTRLGLAVSVIMNSILLSSLHEIGKNRRPGNNALAKVVSFFSPQDKAVEVEADNTIRNVINGGDHVFKKLFK